MLTDEIRSTLRLGVPLILAQLAQMSMSFIDTLMVGRLGSLDLAAVALGTAVFFPVTVVFLGLLLAVTPLVSQAHGAGKREQVARAVRQGLWMATALSLPAVLAIWNAAWLLSWMGHEQRTVELAQGYLRAIVWGVPPLFWFGVLRQFVEGLSRPRVVLILTACGVLLNVAGNWVLMFGRLGFPSLGLAGCGWASTGVYWTMLVALVGVAAGSADFYPYRIFSRLGRPDCQVFGEIYRIGWPIGVMHFLEVGLFSGVTMMMGLFGSVQLAAHQIALNCAAYIFMVPLGLSLAISIRVGQAVGRRDPAGARRSGAVGIGLGATLMTVSAISFWTLPGPIIHLFTGSKDPTNLELESQGAAFLAVAAVFQIFDGIQVTAAGALRGLKDTRAPMWIGMTAYWLVGMTSAWLLAFRYGWEGLGLWWGLVLGLTSAAVLLTWRFRRMCVNLGESA